MLVIARREGERVLLRYPGQPDVWITVSQAHGCLAKLVFDAPKEVVILREELVPRQGKDARADQ